MHPPIAQISRPKHLPTFPYPPSSRDAFLSEIKTGYRYFYAKPKMKSRETCLGSVIVCVVNYSTFEQRVCRFHICWLPEDSTTLSDRLIKSWVRHRLVAASSRRTEEKVASRRGSGRHCRSASRARALSLSLLWISIDQTKLRTNAYLKKQRTTCFSSLAVCCSTNCETILLSTVPTA